MKPRVENWLRGLVGGGIGGGCSAVTASLGLAGAEAVGASVKALDIKQMCAVFISGVLVSIVLYLKQSPLPPPSTGQTGFWESAGPKDAPPDNKTP